jgi:hypothetical protein
LLRDDEPVALPPKPFALLCVLARHPASLLTKNALLNQVWGHQFVSESVLKTAMSVLRTALGDNARKLRFVEARQKDDRRAERPARGQLDLHGPVHLPARGPPSRHRDVAIRSAAQPRDGDRTQTVR